VGVVNAAREPRRGRCRHRRRHRGDLTTRPRTIGVAFADGADWTGWRPEHRAVLRSALVPLAATGDVWREVPEHLADVVVRTYDSGGHCEHAGMWAVGSREVRIDYACLHGSEVRHAVVLELLHARKAPHTTSAPTRTTALTVTRASPAGRTPTR
jgi:hypothetical protein